MAAKDMSIQAHIVTNCFCQIIAFQFFLLTYSWRCWDNAATGRQATATTGRKDKANALPKCQ